MSKKSLDTIVCECQDTSCGEHLEHYKCPAEAIGTLDNNDENQMDLCAGCAANLLDTCEFESYTWVLFEEAKMKAGQDKTPKQESAWPIRRYEIFQNVLNAMQAAEEIGGLEGSEYLLLMHAISVEANKRAKNAMEQD